MLDLSNYSVSNNVMRLFAEPINKAPTVSLGSEHLYSYLYLGAEIEAFLFHRFAAQELIRS